MNYRGLWTIVASIAIAVLAVLLAPDGYAFWTGMIGVLGGWIGGAIYAVDHYRHIKEFERQRDEFNRRLQERG